MAEARTAALAMVAWNKGNTEFNNNRRTPEEMLAQKQKEQAERKQRLATPGKSKPGKGEAAKKQKQDPGKEHPGHGLGLV